MKSAQVKVSFDGILQMNDTYQVEEHILEALQRYVANGTVEDPDLASALAETLREYCPPLPDFFDSLDDPQKATCRANVAGQYIKRFCPKKEPDVVFSVLF